jgi:hypothetical protein
VKRLMLCALALGLLSGPTSGAVGSCGGEQLDEPADLPSYCSEREQLVCVRRELRHEISIGERDDCRRAALEACSRRFWPADCRPSERQTRACLNALRSTDTLQTPESDLEECHTEALCTVEPRDDAGAGEP